MYSALKDLVAPLQLLQESVVEVDHCARAVAYASLLLGLATTMVCWILHFADQWSYFTQSIRTVLSLYNMVISLVLVTALSYLPGMDQNDTLERVNIRVTPWNWQPTFADRQWLIHPLEGSISTGAIFGAVFPGLMFYLLFFIDHNVSSILSPLPKYQLKKPPAYHWDFFVLGLTFLPCGFLGLPPGNGLIPQAPLHTRLLCTKTRQDIDGVRREVYTSCAEQRYSGLGQAILMFVALACSTAISWIPVGSLFGVLLYLGMVALDGNAIWERILFHATIPSVRPPVPCVSKVSSWSTVQWFTGVQVACTALIFGVAQFARVGEWTTALE
jgi:boron transporter